MHRSVPLGSICLIVVAKHMFWIMFWCTLSFLCVCAHFHWTVYIKRDRYNFGRNLCCHGADCRSNLRFILHSQLLSRRIRYSPPILLTSKYMIDWVLSRLACIRRSRQINGYHPRIWNQALYASVNTVREWQTGEIGVKDVDWQSRVSLY